MNSPRQCADCGTPLKPTGVQPICPACIFKRLSDTGTTLFTAEEFAPRPSPIREGFLSGMDFLAEYELLEEIGRGGMGVIYKAHQPRLDRFVAVKVVHAASAAGELALRRFQSEVKVAAQLDHRNIVRVHDVGALDGCPCYSMEFFPGGSLSHRLGAIGQSPETAVRLLVKVARAVFFAHQRGVLHRDLKPANILLDSQGEPHVADFGLAKQLDSECDVTLSGSILGSPNYMSPEQASGKSSSLTVGTDIYSIGAMLYEALTASPPFMGATPLETMRMVVEDEVRAPSLITSRGDKDLETICLKCLEKDPSRRYATAGELAEDLERWLRHEPILARSTTSYERLEKWIRRRPALAVLSAALVLAMLAGMAGVFWQWREAEVARRNETVQLRRAETALARSALALAESALREGDSASARAALETVPKDLRGNSWEYFQGESDTSRSLGLFATERVVEMVAVPSHASEFVAALESGRVVVFDVRRGSNRLEIHPGFLPRGRARDIRISVNAQGDRLVIGRNHAAGIVVHSLADGRLLKRWKSPPTERLEFSEEGSQLLQATQRGESLLLWDASTGRSIWGRTNGYHRARFLPGGKRILSYSWERQLEVLSAKDGTELNPLEGDYFYGLACQPDGEVVVATNPLGFIRAFNAQDWRLRFEIQPHENEFCYVEFLPGGERFLTAAVLPDRQLAIQCWDVRMGRMVGTLAGGRGEVQAICVHPLSGELIVQGEETRVWETLGAPQWLVLKNGNPHPSALFWGEGDWFFGPGSDGHGSSLLELSDMANRVLWSPQSQSHGQPSMSADGRRVAIGRYNSNQDIVILEQDRDRVREAARVTLERDLDFLRLSPDGSRLAVVTDHSTGLGLVDIRENRSSVSLSTHGIFHISDVGWLRGGEWLVGLVTSGAPRNAPGSMDRVVVWNTRTGSLSRSVAHPGLGGVLVVAPGGERFAEGGNERMVRIRDGSTLSVLREFRAHNLAITALAWHPNRNVLATGSADLTIRLWNLDDGTRMEELRGPISPPNALSFSADGRRLAAASRDGATRLWEPRSLGGRR